MNIRTIIRLLRGYQNYDDQTFSMQKDAYDKAANIVRIYYILMCFWTINLYFVSWRDWYGLDGLPQPLWPIRWLDYVPFEAGLNALAVASMLATLLAALYYDRRAFRILGFLFVLQSFAIPNSFGKINHSMHLWVAAGFFLIFLPDGKNSSITKRHQYLTAFFGTQFLVLSFYTSSGIWKTAGAVIQIFLGEIHAFHPFGLAQHVANRLVQTNYESIFGSYIIEYPYVGWPLFVGAILLELFSFVVAFRPNLHRFWAVNILLLHLGIWLTLHVTFAPNILFMLIFFIYSPFHPKELAIKDVLFSMPVIGDLLWWYSKGNKQDNAIPPVGSPSPNVAAD
ncbi:MAG: hypothetical protein AAF902_02600 [Chloroflexota bacterium]